MYTVIRRDFGVHQNQDNSPNLAAKEWSIYIESRHAICRRLHHRHLSNDKGGEHVFQQTAANFKHYNSTLMEESQRQKRSLSESFMWPLLRDDVPASVYRDNWWTILRAGYCRWNYATSNLFIVLPSDLDSLDGSSPSTAQFRLYFLCNNSMQGSSQQDQTKGLHLTNHPGYNLKRPEEFLQVYGGYVMQMLLMVKNGYIDARYVVPPLGSPRSSWRRIPKDVRDKLRQDIITFFIDPEMAINQLRQDAIDYLVDESIKYLQLLYPPKHPMMLNLTHGQITEIETFLTVEDASNVGGDLNRYIDFNQTVSWKCQLHAHQFLNQESLDSLTDFVRDHGGYVDVPKATLGVKLESAIEADQFLALLAGSKYTFDISISLAWKIPRVYLEELCMSIAKTRTVLLEIDGVTQDMHPQDHFQYKTNLFSDIVRHSDIGLITLHNYPRPRELCLYIKEFEIRLQLSPAPYAVNWLGLGSALASFRSSVSDESTSSDYVNAAAWLKSAMAKQGLSGVTEIGMYYDNWTGILDLEKGVLFEVHSSDLRCSRTVLSSGSLQRLTQDLQDVELDQDLYCMVQTNPHMRELSISTHGRNVLYQAEKIAWLWRNTPIPLYVTLFDRTMDACGRVIAQATIGGGSGSKPQGKVNSITQQDTRAVTMDYELHWDCLLSDHSVSFLEMATQQRPSVLTSLTLDVSKLSRTGLNSVQRVLSLSNMEHLHVVCTHFDPNLSDSIADVLGSIQWFTLKSLILTGDNIDKWILFWPSNMDPRLLRFEIRGSGTSPQELSHLSTMFIHHLVYESQPLEVHFKNVQLQHERNWMLIVDSLDLTLLESFSVCPRIASQLVLIPHAVNLLTLKFMTSIQRAMILKYSFTLDISPWGDLDLMKLYNTMSQSCLRQLRIACNSLDPNMFSFLRQLLDSVHWPTLKSLSLYGNHIEEWLQLFPSIDLPHLTCLDIRGTKSAQQPLSHSSAVFIQRLLESRPLEEICILDVELWDEHDWVPIVEGMDVSALEKYGPTLGTKSQFMSTEAADLYRSKIYSIEYGSESEEEYANDSVFENTDVEDMGEDDW